MIMLTIRMKWSSLDPIVFVLAVFISLTCIHVVDGGQSIPTHSSFRSHSPTSQTPWQSRHSLRARSEAKWQHLKREREEHTNKDTISAEVPHAQSQKLIASCTADDHPAGRCQFECFQSTTPSTATPTDRIALALQCSSTTNSSIQLHWSTPSMQTSHQVDQFRYELQVNALHNCTKPRTLISLRPTFHLDALKSHCSYTMSLQAYRLPSTLVLSNPDDPQHGDLMDLYVMTNGPAWRRSQNWGTNSSVCTWYGITCYQNITSPPPGINPLWIAIISLHGNKLTATQLPNPFLPNILALQALALHDNLLATTFPNISHLVPGNTLLNLTIGNNPHMQDIVPSWVFQMTNLRNLTFDISELSCVTSSFRTLTNLEVLDIHYAYIIGYIQDFAHLTNMTYLDVSSTGLSSSPMINFDGFTQLNFLNLENIPVVGTWPDLSHLTSLQYLDLSFTKLSGVLQPLPPGLIQFVCQACPVSDNIFQLYYLTKLQGLLLSYTSNLMHINATEFALNMLEVSSLSLDGIHVFGDAHAFNLMTNLTELSLVGCQMDPQPLPDFQLPNLYGLSLSGNNFFGEIPSFSGCPQLTFLLLSNNDLSGPFPNLTTWCTGLQHLDLGNNQLVGSLPSFNWSCPTVRMMSTLTLQDNYFTGEIEDAFFDVTLFELNLGNNYLTGSIPTFQNSSTQNQLTYLYLSDNDLTSTIPPLDLPSLTVLDLNRNHLQGSVDFTQMNLPNLIELRLAENLLVCPVHFPPSIYQTVQHLDLSLNSFNVMDEQTKRETITAHLNKKGRQTHPWIDYTIGESNACTLDFLWSRTFSVLDSFDASNNRWAGNLPAILPPALESFSCSNCGLQIDGLPPGWTSSHALQSISIHHNSISSLLEFVPPNVIAIDASFCNLTGGDFFKRLIDNAEEIEIKLQYLDVSYNNIASTIPVDMFSTSSQYNWLLGLRELNMAHNLLVGTLPLVDIGFDILSKLDFSFNNLSGTIPESFGNFIGLRELRLEGNPNLQNISGGLPSFIVQSDDGSSTNNALGGYTCPSLRIQSYATLGAMTSTLVTLDSLYYQYSLCSCNDNYFGQGINCTACGQQCVCSGTLLADCFPVPLTTTATDEFYTFIPCPLTMTGGSLCNPHGLPFNFSYAASSLWGSATIQGPPSNISSNSTLADSWCWPGHQGRLCGQCADNYFSSGRWCVQCLPPAVHALIFFVCGALFVVFMVFLFMNAPSPKKLLGGLNISKQINRQRAKENKALVNDGDVPKSEEEYEESVYPSSDDDEDEESNETINTNVAQQLNDVVNIEAAIGVAIQKEPNWWKLLLFHLQQLGVILYTQTSLPTGMISFLSASNSASSFSFSSLIAVECVTRWDIADQIYASFILPFAVLGLVGALLLFQLYRRRHGLDEESESEDESDSAGSSTNSRETASAKLSRRIWRVFGVCWSLLYVLAFPCAQLALTALGCTDTREGSNVYLNQLPWVNCSTDFYTRHILPPAIISAILWLFVFPIVSTLVYFRLRRSLFEGEVHVWSVLGQVVGPYRLQWWLWEQVILFRRLALVACVALVPTYSLYLPLLLFLLIQLSALGQHICKPYASIWSHRAELTSLYLLQLTYFTAVILHKDAQTGADYEQDSLQNTIWTTVLFSVNVIFVLLLLLGVSYSFRSIFYRILKYTRRRVRRLFRSQPIREAKRKVTVPPLDPMYDPSLDIAPSMTSQLDESRLFQPQRQHGMFYVDSRRQLQYVAPTPGRTRVNSDAIDELAFARSKSFSGHNRYGYGSHPSGGSSASSILHRTQFHDPIHPLGTGAPSRQQLVRTPDPPFSNDAQTTRMDVFKDESRDEVSELPHTASTQPSTTATQPPDSSDHPSHHSYLFTQSVPVHLTHHHRRPIEDISNVSSQHQPSVNDLSVPLLSDLTETNWAGSNRESKGDE